MPPPAGRAGSLTMGRRKRERKSAWRKFARVGVQASIVSLNAVSGPWRRVAPLLRRFLRVSPVRGCAPSTCSRYDDDVTSFTAEARDQLKPELLEFAKQDPRLSGGAVTGSAAGGREDRWSDIDLAFGVSDPALVGVVLMDFSNFMYTQGALHHHDVRAGAWIYRVFFLPGGLQVDLAFVEQGEFRPLGPAFQLVFGAGNRCSLFRAQIPGT
jgi:hypothetical protein